MYINAKFNQLKYTLILYIVWSIAVSTNRARRVAYRVDRRGEKHPELTGLETATSAVTGRGFTRRDILVMQI